MKHLFIDTITINSISQSSTGGDIGNSASALYSNIKGRIDDLGYRDLRFVESREEYADITKKCFVEASKTGISNGDQLVHGSDTYHIRHVKRLQDATGVHHFELFLAIVK